MFYKIRALAIVAGLFMLLTGDLFAQTPGDIFAQTPRELRFNSWVSGKLREGEEQWYIVRPLESGIAVVETSGDTDTYLEAYDSAGALIDKNDDGGEGNNARLEVFAEAGKSYRFKLKNYNDEGGSYQLLASFEALPPDTDRNTERSRAVPIRLGESFPVYFRSSGESRWYRYDISRAGTLFVVQTRGNLDTLLSLYDAHGNLLEEDDDSGEDGNALVSKRIGSGTVYIEIKEYDNKTGRCTLHAETR